MNEIGQVLRLIYCRLKIENIKLKLKEYDIHINPYTDTYLALHMIHIVYNYTKDEDKKNEIVKILVGENKAYQDTFKEIMKGWN